MTGAILLATVALWIWTCSAITRFVLHKVQSKQRRTLLTPAVFAALFVLPVFDEVVGRFQFESLCRANGIEKVNISKAHGMQVTVEYGRRSVVEGMALPTLKSSVLYRQRDTGVVIFEHLNYYADGGWLMRHTLIGMGSSQPIFFSGNGCGFAQRDRLFAINHVLIVH